MGYVPVTGSHVTPSFHWHRWLHPRLKVKEDVSPACFARLVKAYYQSVYHVTFSFVAFASGEFFEAMEIVDGSCARFSTADLLYVHCIDSNVQFEYSFSGVASLNLISVLGHVSFPSDLRSRRLVLFLYTKEIRDCLENKRSPIVCRVKASCFFEVSQVSVLLFNVFSFSESNMRQMSRCVREPAEFEI